MVVLGAIVRADASKPWGGGNEWGGVLTLLVDATMAEAVLGAAVWFQCPASSWVSVVVCPLVVVYGVAISG